MNVCSECRHWEERDKESMRGRCTAYGQDWLGRIISGGVAYADDSCCEHFIETEGINDKSKENSRK